MSREDIERFLEEILKDQVLQEKVKLALSEQQITDRSSLAKLAVELGREAGHQFSENDVQEALAEMVPSKHGELSDQSLDEVAGGAAYGGNN